MDAKRKAFIEKHGFWIELLNKRKQIEQGKSCIITKTTMKKGELDHTSQLDISIPSEYFKDWQYKHFILDGQTSLENGVLKRNIDLLSSKPKFSCEREFELALAEWMYENLRAVSRGDSEGLILEVGKIGYHEIDSLLGVIHLGVPFWETKDIIYYDYQNTDLSYLPELAHQMHIFLEYLRDVLHGLQGKAVLGIYKVGVCPYRKLKDKNECGNVFVGSQWNSGACEEHEKKWQAMKHRRKVSS